MMRSLGSLLAVIAGAVAVTAQTPPSNLSDYVALGVNTLPDARKAKGGKLVLDDKSFVTEGSVGVTGSTQQLPTSLKFGQVVFVANGSAVVSDQCSSGGCKCSSTGCNPGGTCTNFECTSVYDLFTNSVVGNNNCKASFDQTAKTTYGVRDPQVDGVTFSPPAVMTLPSLPIFAPGGTDVTVPTPPNPYDPIVTLAAGAYRDVDVQDKAELDLTGTHYEFRSLKVEKFGKVRVTVGSTINIQGGLTVGEFGSFGPAPNVGVNPNDIQVNVGCGSTQDPTGCTIVTFDAATHAGMALYAPDAQLNLHRSFRGKGQFIANYVNGDQTLLLRAARAQVYSANTFITLTQNQYGAATGLANGPTGYVTNNPGILPVTLGAPGVRSLTIPRPPTGQPATALQCLLPVPDCGDGTTSYVPSALCGATGNDCGCNPEAMSIGPTSCQGLVDFIPFGAQTCNGAATCSDPTGCSGGQGGGTLTAQTLTAKLNVALSNIGTPSGTPLGLGDFVVPACLCTSACPQGRFIDNTAQLQQGPAGGLENGLTTVNDLIAFADEALSADCGSSGSCSNTCGTAFAPPDPIRIGEMEWALKAINECFNDPQGNPVSVTACPGPCPAPSCP